MVDTPKGTLTCAICDTSFRISPAWAERRVTCSRNCSSVLKATRAAARHVARGIDIGDLRERHAAGASVRQLSIEIGLRWDSTWRLLGKPRIRDTQIPPEPEPLFLAWAAGFFDGEGSVSMTPMGSLYIRLPQTVREPIDALCDAFGGGIQETPSRDGHKPQWAWYATGAHALNVLRLLRPHLRVRSAVADVAMEHYTAFVRSKPGQLLTPQEREKRTAGWLAVKAMNQRGVPKAA